MPSLLYRKIRQLVRNLTCRFSWSNQLESFIQWILDTKERTASTVTKAWSILDLIQLYSTILQAIIVLLIPLDPVYRILLYDNTFFIGIPQYHNWMHILMMLNCLYFRWMMYHHHPLALMQLLSVVRRGSVCSFFLHQHMPHKGSVCLVTRVILQYGNMWIHIVRQFYMLAVFYSIYLAARALDSLLLLHAKYCCSPTWIGCLYMTVTAMNYFGFCLALFMFVHVHLLWGQMVVLFTCIFFLKLRQVNELLNWSGQKRHTRSGLTTCTLYRFIRAHTQTLVMIFEYNRFYGNLLLIFIVLNVPQNTFIFSFIVLNRFPPAVKFAYGDYFIGQVVFIAIFHLLAAAYSSRIHRCGKLLAIASARRMLTGSPIRAQIALSLYYQKFSGKKKYGITYGSFGLISFASFAKFLLLYGECLMKWFASQ